MATLIELQAAVDKAQANLVATINLGNQRAEALNRCNCGKGKTLTGVCTPYKSIITFPTVASAQDCITPPPINNCKSDCCDKQTCESKVVEYNLAVGYYNSAVSVLDAANKAKANFVATDPAILADIEAQEEQAAIARQKWYFAGIVVLVLGVLTFSYFKWWRKKA